ncbi:hypothetical protein [Halomonas sp. 18071143]|uniref:hypothetical protein n=2 Tax=unclassified Halomonas TaxID=2609666 RepID=UPI001C446450|nr:hypothetical protein [Halomonas sp. 18071143]
MAISQARIIESMEQACSNLNPDEFIDTGIEGERKSSIPTLNSGYPFLAGGGSWGNGDGVLYRTSRKTSYFCARMDSEGRESAPSPASIVAQYTA